MNEHNTFNPGELLEELLVDTPNRYAVILDSVEVVLVDDTIAAAKLEKLGIPRPERIAADKETLMRPPFLALVEDIESDT